MSEFSFDDFDLPDFSLDEVKSPEPTVEPIAEPVKDEPKPVIEKPVADMTTAEVNEAFDDLASLIEADEEVVRTSSALVEAEYVVAQAEKAQEEARVEYDEVTKQRQALEAQLAQIISRQNELRAKANEVRSNVREAERKKESARRSVRIAKQAVRVRYERSRKAASFSELAKDKAWFTGNTSTGLRILDHQWDGAQFLATAQRAILGDGMGLGKTLTCIAALDLVESKRCLIIAQNDITTNFDAEVRMWAPHRNVVNIRGMAREQRNMLLDSIGTFMENMTVVVNYEAWRKDKVLLEKFISLGFDTMILDEAHNIKDTDTDAFKGVKAVAHAANLCPKDGSTLPELVDVNGKPLVGQRMCVKCGWQGESWDLVTDDPDLEVSDQARWSHIRSVKNLWCVTGTPILNKPQDLFSMLNLLDPANFHFKSHFLNDYCEMDYYSGQWKFGPGGAERLLNHRLRGKYMARSMQDAGIILPEQKPVIHNITMDYERYAAQAEVIRQLRDHAQIVMSDGRSMSALAQITVLLRQRQANVWPGGINWETLEPTEDGTMVSKMVSLAEEVTESIKIDKAVELIAEAVDQGHRVVLFSQFKSALAETFNRINGFVTDSGNTVSAVRFDGDTKEETRRAIKSNFDKKMGEAKKWDVVLAHYRTGGTGLNLTAARTTIILDEEWNPGKRDQAYARTHRMGQDDVTFVHVLRLEKTVDSWLARLIDNKAAIIGGFDDAAVDMQAEYIKGIESGEFNL